MVIKNKKSAHQQVVTEDQWKDMQGKSMPGNPKVKFSSMFDVVDKDAMTLSNVSGPTNVPETLKKTSPKTEGKK